MTLNGGQAAAAVTLPHIIGSHMVLQREIPLRIWGWAEAGEQVTVSIAGRTVSGRAGKNGEWMVVVPAMKAGGPHEMTVTGKTGTIRLTDILVGEVWLASGQSNMEMGLHAVADGEAECAAADHPNIRLFYVPQRPSGQPVPDVNSSWKPCTPETVRQGKFDGFSAAAYYFGRRLQEQLDVPIGLIDSTWGGTRIEPWTSPEGFGLVEELEEFSQKIGEANQQYRQALGPALDPLEEWIAATRTALDEGTDVPLRPPIPNHPLGNQRQPTGLYNGMIHGLIPFGIRGALWYQGESNVVPYDEQYTLKMKAMIEGWRRLWGQGDFPFYYVQIAPFNLRLFIRDINPEFPVLIREQQLEAMAIPNTGMVVTMDIGNLRDIHPKNKKDVGDRLARWALAKTYGRKNVVYSGPIYKAMRVEGSKIRIAFHKASVGGGLASRDGEPLTWFQIAGEDKEFHEAKAEIDGNTVVVSSDEVAEPVAVRFGWDMVAEPNLMNKEGLPAAPFRTDKW